MKETRDERKGEQKGTPTSGTDAPRSLLWSGEWDARSRRKHLWWCGVVLHTKGRGELGLVISSHDSIGENYKRMNRAGKGKS